MFNLFDYDSKYLASYNYYSYNYWFHILIFYFLEDIFYLLALTDSHQWIMVTRSKFTACIPPRCLTERLLHRFSWSVDQDTAKTNRIESTRVTNHEPMSFVLSLMAPCETRCEFDRNRKDDKTISRLFPTSESTQIIVQLLL